MGGGCRDKCIICINNWKRFPTHSTRTQIARTYSQWHDPLQFLLVSTWLFNGHSQWVGCSNVPSHTSTKQNEIHIQVLYVQFPSSTAYYIIRVCRRIASSVTISFCDNGTAMQTGRAACSPIGNAMFNLQFNFLWRRISSFCVWRAGKSLFYSRAWHEERYRLYWLERLELILVFW